MNHHQTTVGKNDERFTPPAIWRALDVFDTDAATGAIRPWTIGTRLNLTPEDDSLAMDWRDFGRVWLNPPFNRYVVGDFVRKMCEHDHGTLLLHVRTETDWFHPIWYFAAGLLFLRKRQIFHNADGSLATITNPQAKHFGKTANSGAPIVLCAFGQFDLDVLAGCGIEGHFQPLRFPIGVLVMPADQSWRETVRDWLARQTGPVHVADLYRVFCGHPKAKTNPHWKEKIRQTLQRGAGKSVGRDQWVAA